MCWCLGNSGTQPCACSPADSPLIPKIRTQPEGMILATPPTSPCCLPCLVIVVHQYLLGTQKEITGQTKRLPTLDVVDRTCHSISHEVLELTTSEDREWEGIDPHPIYTTTTLQSHIEAHLQNHPVQNTTGCAPSRILVAKVLALHKPRSHMGASSCLGVHFQSSYLLVSWESSQV